MDFTLISIMKLKFPVYESLLISFNILMVINKKSIITFIQSMILFIIIVIKGVSGVAVSEQLKILCVKLGISVSELGRLSGKSPQAFSQKMKRESFTVDELKHIAEASGCKLSNLVHFEPPVRPK